jgi:hypothetical protein
VNTSSLRRAVATATVCAAGLAGTLAAIPSADAHGAAARSDRLVKTNLGYKATVYGTKVLVDGVEVRNAKEAFAQQRCTRFAGRQVLKNSTLTIPDNELVHVSAASSRTNTYVKDGVNGVRGISTIGDLALGGEFQGVQTPTLSLQGLTSTADSFRKADGTFGHQESFSFDGLHIGNLPEQIPQELQDLLDVLGSTTGDVANQVIQLLSQTVGNEIEIPGLGSIGLGGVKSGKAGPHSASSQSYALRVLVNATGHDTMITLGRARTAITEPVPAGVFHSRAMGLEMLSGNALLSLGGLQEQALPCSGTNGKVEHHKIADVSVLGGLVTMSGLDYAQMGDQNPNGSAKGFVSSTIGSLEVPSIGLVIDGIFSKVNVVKQKGQTKVDRKVTTGIAKITLNGEPIALPDPGQTIELGDQGFLKYQVVKSNWTGSEVRAFQLTLPDLLGGSILDVGWAGAHIVPN